MAVHGAHKVGLLAGLNDEYWVDAPDTSSAVIKVVGDFNGVLQVDGSALPASEAKQIGVVGGRIVFKSGVGSLGENKIRNTGSDIENEYRIVTGGQSIRIKMVEWTSGIAYVRVVASHDASVVFINGPVHNTEEEAIRAGRAYSVGTGTQSATSGQFIKATFTNPADSGVNVFVTLRQFTNSSTSNLPELQFFVSPPPLAGTPTPTQVTPNNLKTGAAPSVVEFEYQVNTTSIGTPVLSQVLPINGVSKDIAVTRWVQPSESFGYQIAGAGGGLQNALRASMTFVWYEETLN